jgi:hypothetical protein
VTFRPDYDGIGDMLRAPFMVAEMRRRAEAGLQVAVAVAPRATGEYVASLGVRSGITQGRRTRRAFGRLESTDDKALNLEYGTENTPAFRTLGKALDAMGR